jgi:iron complex outermembrane receptor protein
LDYQADLLEATLGAESRWGDIRAKRFVNVNGTRGTQTFAADRTARTSTLYGEVRIKPVPTLSLIAGGIYADGFRQQQQRVPALVSGRADFDAFSPKFGLLWDARQDIQFFANYSRSVEFPTFVELAQIAAFVPVKPQRAWTGEIGTRGKIGRASWDIAVYRAALKGEILQFTTGPDIPASTFNAQNTRHSGVEASIILAPAPWFRLRQNWLYSNFRFERDTQFGNNRLPVVPRHVLRSEIRLGSIALHAAANVEWVPRGAWADYRNSARNPGYALIGVTGAAKLREGLDLFVDVRNIGATKSIGDVSAVIQATPTSVIYYPLERRAIYGGFRARF